MSWQSITTIVRCAAVARCFESAMGAIAFISANQESVAMSRSKIVGCCVAGVEIGSVLMVAFAAGPLVGCAANSEQQSATVETVDETSSALVTWGQEIFHTHSPTSGIATPESLSEPHNVFSSASPTQLNASPMALGLAVFGPDWRTNLSGVSVRSWNHVTGRRDGFFIGTNHEVQHLWSETWGSGWGQNSWGKPPGKTPFGLPGVASGKDGRVEVYVLAEGSIVSVPELKSIWRRYYDNGSFGNWEHIGGVVVYDSPSYDDWGVAAVSWGPNRTDLLIPESATSYKHFYTDDAGSTWSSGSWPMPGPFFGVPAVASWGDQRIDIFYQAADLVTLGHAYYDHGTVGSNSWGSPCSSGELLVGLRGADAMVSGPNVHTVQAAVGCSSDGKAAAFYHRVGVYSDDAPFQWRSVTPSPGEPAGRWKGVSGALVVRAL